MILSRLGPKHGRVRAPEPRDLVWASFVAAGAMLAVLWLTSTCGCGGSASAWTPEDTTSAADVANGALSLEAVCDRDGGPCPGAAVRAIERGTYCAAAAQLVRHRQDVPDAGPGGPRCTR